MQYRLSRKQGKRTARSTRPASKAMTQSDWNCNRRTQSTHSQTHNEQLTEYTDTTRRMDTHDRSSVVNCIRLPNQSGRDVSSLLLNTTTTTTRTQRTQRVKRQHAGEEDGDTHPSFSSVNFVRLPNQSGRDVSWLVLNKTTTHKKRTQRVARRRNEEEDDDTHDRSSEANCVRLPNQSGRDVRRRELQVNYKCAQQTRTLATSESTAQKQQHIKQDKRTSNPMKSSRPHHQNRNWGVRATSIRGSQQCQAPAERSRAMGDGH